MIGSPMEAGIGAEARSVLGFRALGFRGLGLF